MYVSSIHVPTQKHVDMCRDPCPLRSFPAQDTFLKDTWKIAEDVRATKVTELERSLERLGDQEESKTPLSTLERNP